MELFVKIVKNGKLLTVFVKTSSLDVWQGSEYASFWIGFQSYGCFIYKSIWISKVTDNLLGKTKQKKPAKLQNGWKKIWLNKGNS